MVGKKTSLNQSVSKLSTRLQAKLPSRLQDSLVEQDVVLGTHAHRGADDVHIGPDVSPVNVSSA